MASRFWLALAFAALWTAACQKTATAPAPAAPHNVVIFIADGMRYSSVNPTDAPELDAVRTGGVDFANSHSLYPTVTTVNASAITTGHYIGDTGNFGNTIFVGMPPLAASGNSRVAGLEDDDVLRDMNARFGGNYLGEVSLLAAARAKGFSTAALGKTGPAGILDISALTSAGGVVIDEATGSPATAAPRGIALSADLAKAIDADKLSPSPPGRALPNVNQSDWFAKVATEVLIPQFKTSGRPFVLVFWSADPDGTQHGQTDGDGLTPGVNGPTSKAAVANASRALGRIREALKAQGLEATTDIFVTADHGFSTVAKDSRTSYSATLKYHDIPAGQLPPGFVAIDLSHALNLPLFQPNGLAMNLADGLPAKSASAMMGPDIDNPRVIVAANGGTDLIYLPDASAAKQLAPKIVEFLTQQDYTGGIFVDEDTYGKQPGALALSDVRLVGSAKTPRPAIVVSLRSYPAPGCTAPAPELCSALIVDGSYRPGQGSHGSLERGETRNFMAAIGPDFKSTFVNSAPISNADIAPTIAHILGIELPSVGKLKGRVITEALKNGQDVQPTAETKTAAPAPNGFATRLDLQRVGDAEYFDAAGADGRAVGLKPAPVTRPAP